MKRLLACLMLCVCVLGAASSPAKAGKPYIVLALSGGGVKGYAHIGVLEQLEKNGIGVAGIVGTSMGSIVGSLYSAGLSVDDLKHVVNTINLGELVMGRGGGEKLLSDASSRDISVLRPELYTDKKNNPVGPLGLYSGTEVFEYFGNLMSHVTVTDFMELPIPFAAIATDLTSGEKVVLNHGSLPSAVRASMSIPGVFDPWEIDGRLLVDGGMVSNMPVETARELFPGYPVVAVNLTSELGNKSTLHTMMDVVSQSITVLTIQNVRREAKLADLVIDPHVREYPVLGTTPAEEIIAQGREATIKVMPQLKKILARAPRHPIHPKNISVPAPRIMDVRITGVPSRMAENIRYELIREWLGRPVPVKEIINAAARIAKREDVRSVDYNMLDTDRGVVVEMKVQRNAAHRYVLGAYGNTLQGEGNASVDIHSYDVLHPGDTLRSKFYISDKWGVDMDYFWGINSARDTTWSLDLTASKSRLAAPVEWQKYEFGINKNYILGKNLRFSAGLTGMKLAHVKEADNDQFFTPDISCSYIHMDDPADPEEGWMARVRLLWPENLHSLLLRSEFLGSGHLGDDIIAQIQGGWVEGNMDDSHLYSAYVGGREELYSFIDKPYESDRFLWWRLKLRYPFSTTMFGPTYAELFGGQAYAWDHAKKHMHDPWEAGIALCVPRRLFEGKVYAVYSDNEKWRFG